MSPAIDALRKQTKIQPEATSRPKMYWLDGMGLVEAVGLQTAVQTSGYRHLGRGIETMAAAPAFQRVNKSQ